MKIVPRSKKILALIFLSIAICTCIEFKSQQMYWSHDEIKDELIIVNVFRRYLCRRYSCQFGNRSKWRNVHQID